VLTYVGDDRGPSAVLETDPGVREALRDNGAKLLREARERVAAQLEAVVEDLREGRFVPA
jgi:hypothetical protein